MRADKVRKGMKAVVEDVVVRVTRREKWNSRHVKIHFEDCGNGLPRVRCGLAMVTLRERFYNLDELLNIVE